ncbi:MAG TPA: replicative DNA helicase [Salinivirgaceae bacterium]|nr:replicative DNA helicase [Salinivirgaceae bacterium]
MAKTKRQVEENQSIIVDGKVPPHDIEIEKAVLGALMLDKDALNDIIGLLKESCFYGKGHGKIFKAITEMFDSNSPIDILTVSNTLHNKGELEEVGGRSYIASLTADVAGTHNLEYHAKVVAQKYIQRELIRVASDIQKRAFDESYDVQELLDYSENEIFKISEGSIKKDVLPINIILRESLHQIEANSKKGGGLNGVPSGFTHLDYLTNGWQSSDLIIVAARPSMGKTAFVLSMARSISIEHQIPVAFFSLEMSSVQLVNRLIAGECEINANKLRSGNLQDWEWQKLEQRLKNLRDSKLFIDDTAAISVSELRGKCRRLVYEHKIELIIVDYLQLMTAGQQASREQEVATISRSLKALAKELNVPIIALSQLNRALETRAGNKRPQLSDLRESGSIEQDADLVIFIHRPEYYQIPTVFDGSDSHGKAEIIVAKHRNGAIGDIILNFRSEFASFTDIRVEGMADISNFEHEAPIIQSKMNDEVDEFIPDLLHQNNDDLLLADDPDIPF